MESLNAVWLAQVVEGSPVPMLVIDAQHRVVLWNRALELVSQTPAAEVVGTTRSWAPFYVHERPIMADLIVDGCLEDGVGVHYAGKCRPSQTIAGAWEAEDFFPHFAEGGKWLAFTAAPLRDGQGRIVGAIETLQDITVQKTTQQALEREATHDALTGLGNRVLLQRSMEQALAHARREGLLMAVVFMDLDNFKIINDTLGHKVGDEIIREAARRITGSVRASDTVARIGGDEFVVLLYAPDSETAIAEVMQRLIDDISQPIHVDGQALFVGCSIGTALYPRDGEDAATLMMNADAAMYRSKESGRNMFHFFAQEMNDAANERLRLSRDLRFAVERGELVLHYQPQVSLETGQVVGAEALLRWRHPTDGLLPPARFIPLAEDNGLIVPIGRWVMEQACLEAKRWSALTGRELRLSLNLSPRQFRQDALVQEVAHLVELLGGSRVCLELEVTENMVMQDLQQAAEVMHELRALGVRMSMDDFGTGYSSLGYLRSFPFDLIKIDRSFITELGRCQGSEAIVRAIIAMAGQLGLEVIAEGVETPAQGSFLLREGCGMAQGFHFGRPMPAEDFRKALVA